MVSPMWTCPGCGRPFANRNQTHSCRPLGDLDRLFEGCASQVRECFERVLAAARRAGPLTVLPERTRVAFQVRMSFAAFQPRRCWLDGHVVLARELPSPRFRRIEVFSAAQRAARVPAARARRGRRRGRGVARRGLPRRRAGAPAVGRLSTGRAGPRLRRRRWRRRRWSRSRRRRRRRRWWRRRWSAAALVAAALVAAVATPAAVVVLAAAAVVACASPSGRAGRRATAAVMASARPSTAPMAEVTVSPVTNAVRAASASSGPPTATAPPSVSRAVCGASAGRPAR